MPNNPENYEPTNQDIMNTIGEMMLSIEKIKNQVSKMYLKLVIQPAMEVRRHVDYTEDCGAMEP